MAHHIAIVEDEPALAANYRDSLQRMNYAVSVHHNRQAALNAFNSALPDLVIIDIMLGDEAEGGFDLCRELRSRSATLPMVFLTARDSEIDIVCGLLLGADDYFSKDIGMREMQARIATLLRRTKALAAPEQPEHRIVRGALRLNVERLTVSWHDHPVALTVVEHAMLRSLAERPGHAKSRQQLLDAAAVVQDESTVNSHIRRIRRKFETVDPDFNQIEAVYALGYRWIAD